MIRPLLVSLVLVTSVSAQLPPGATPLLRDDPRALEPNGPHIDLGRIDHPAVENRPFTTAVRVETVKKPPFPWDVQLTATTTAPVKKGDTLLAAFTARRLKTMQETGEALVEIIFERSEKPFEKLLERALSVGPEWTDIRIPFVADRDADAGALQLSLRLGYNPQTIEIGAINVHNYGPGVPVASLPKTDTSYEGSEPDAPWRREAAERIERLRKGDLTVTVRDGEGRPVAGARVAVRMKRHAFGFGTAIVTAPFVGEDTPDKKRYRDTIEKHFNKIVFENELKWPAWIEQTPEGLARRENIGRTLDWLDARGIPARGHVMVWPSWRYLPKHLKAMENDPAALRKAVLDHIADQTRTFGSRITEWDVINESYAHNDLLRILGREVMVDWYKAARAGAPNVRLFYNDYVMFSGEGPNSPSQYYFDTAKFLLDQGAPLGGLGEQGHFGGSPASPVEVLAKLDRFGSLGVPIQITEFDIDTSDTDLQVAYTRDFLTAAFSHPSVSGIMCWGFWESMHWKPRAAFWAKDWSLRPGGKVWVDLTMREWWTNADLVTGADGRASVRGFLGDYDISATDTGRGTAKTAHVLTANDGAITLNLRR